MFSCSEIRILTKSFFVRRWSSACFNHCFTFLLLLLGKGSSKVGNLSASGGGKIARGAQDFPPQASPVRFAGLAKGHPVLSEEEKKEKKKEKFRAVQMSSKPQQKHVLVHFVLHVSLFKNILRHVLDPFLLFGVVAEVSDEGTDIPSLPTFLGKMT